MESYNRNTTSADRQHSSGRKSYSNQPQATFDDYSDDDTEGEEGIY